MPRNGFGSTDNLIYTDDYYTFTNIPLIPTRIPLSNFFTENSDLIKDLSVFCRQWEKAGYPAVEVPYAKSDFQGSFFFDTNRKLSLSTFHPSSIFDLICIEPGVYGRGARKLIHRESGIQNNGDAYGQLYI